MFTSSVLDCSYFFPVSLPVCHQLAHKWLHEPQILFGGSKPDPLLTQLEFLPVWRGESVWPLTCVCVWECVGGTKASLVFHGGGMFLSCTLRAFSGLMSHLVVMVKVLKTEGTHSCEYVCKPQRWLLQEILLQQFIFRNLIKRFPTMSNTSRQGNRERAFILRLLTL